MRFFDTVSQKVMGVRVAGAMQPSAKKKGATAALRGLLDDARGTCLIELLIWIKQIEYTWP